MRNDERGLQCGCAKVSTFKNTKLNLNTSIAELPKEGEGRRWPFGGAVVYTALLLILSHFEKGAQ